MKGAHGRLGLQQGIRGLHAMVRPDAAGTGAVAAAWPGAQRTQALGTLMLQAEHLCRGARAGAFRRCRRRLRLRFARRVEAGAGEQARAQVLHGRAQHVQQAARVRGLAPALLAHQAHALNITHAAIWAVVRRYTFFLSLQKEGRNYTKLVMHKRSPLHATACQDVAKQLQNLAMRTSVAAAGPPALTAASPGGPLRQSAMTMKLALGGPSLASCWLSSCRMHQSYTTFRWPRLACSKNTGRVVPASKEH